MQIWYMEPFPCGDKRLPHHVFPPKFISIDQLMQISGVVHYKVDLKDTVAMKKRLSRVRNETGYTKSDILTLNEEINGFAEKLDDLYEPVNNDNEEMLCMVLEGGLYCDVEIDEDEWIRIHMEDGDLIVVPKGRAYRYTTTSKNFVRLQRFARRCDEVAQG
ncbi:unnamed protein product [Bursaphelenchus xylophilus]|uniref:(pine wood nematode) hypothetical protein n=1 Tax=Bursaphelenchus xylophilus TaxID=6326 RepID=A0A1I7SRI7_BURXY|nr:unnamed protein product [Bursaphelenchus xylophilus]CAG9102331.1 unnamed protein product [Bursaphelenchus xylophilus]